MLLLGLTLLFLALMIVQGLVVTEAYTSPGTEVQMNANRPAVWVVETPEYVQEAPQIPWWAPFRSYWLGLARN